MIWLWLTGGGSLAAALGAAAWFSPMFKRELAMAAGAVLLATAVYGYGVHDEKVKRDARDAAFSQKVDKAVTDAKTSPTKDKFDDPNN